MPIEATSAIEATSTEAPARRGAAGRALDGDWDHGWNDGQPIYRQLRERLVAMILDGTLNEGDSLPSVRKVAADYCVNPLTVLKAYQQLVGERLVEKKRGRGLFINAGARDVLLQGERQKFLVNDWPRIHATIRRLGLEPAELLCVGAGFPLEFREDRAAGRAGARRSRTDAGRSSGQAVASGE